MQQLADMFPEKGLLPAYGTPERWHAMELMHFLATELHKGFSPFYNPKANAEFRETVSERLALRFAELERTVGAGPFALGAHFSVVDGYAFYVLYAYQHAVKGSLTPYPGLAAYYARLLARPSIKAALEAEAALA